MQKDYEETQKFLKKYPSLDKFIRRNSNNQLNFDKFVSAVQKTVEHHKRTTSFNHSPAILKTITTGRTFGNLDSTDSWPIHRMFDAGIDWQLHRGELWPTLNSRWRALHHDKLNLSMMVFKLNLELVNRLRSERFRVFNEKDI